MKQQPLTWLLLSFISGCLVPLAFAPFDSFGYFFPFLIFPLFALFFLQIYLSRSLKQAFLQSWLFGFGLFLTGISWVYVAINEYGSTPWWLAGLFTLIFIVFLALFFALQGGLSYFLMNKLLTGKNEKPQTMSNGTSSKGIILLLLFPLIGVLFEWLRSWALTGLPWLLVGYSQISTPLSGYAPIIGVYGLSLISLTLSGVIVLCFSLNRVKNIILFFAIVSIFMLGYFLQQQQWTSEEGKPLTVSLVQGNVSQHHRWEIGFLQGIKQRYYSLSENLWLASDVVVWPENAIPIFYQYEQETLFKKIKKQVIEHDVTFITGVPFWDKEASLAKKNVGKRIYYNSLMKMEENSLEFYFKQHLVPFGEYLPLEKWLRGVIKFFNIPMSGFSLPPAEHRVVKIKGIPVAITLCYEDIFQSLLLNQLPEAKFLINLSNNGWYGDSLAPHQHLQIAQMRALETGRELLRSTTSGISALIDANGKIKTQTKQFEIAVLQGKIQPRTGLTPFVNYGNTALLVYAILASLLLFNLFRPQIET